MSVYVIADIHGCYKDFMKLIKKSDFKWENDELIIAGDLIERGPDNYKMLKNVKAFSLRSSDEINKEIFKVQHFIKKINFIPILRASAKSETQIKGLPSFHSSSSFLIVVLYITKPPF